MKKEWLIATIGGGWKEFEHICAKLGLGFEVTGGDRFVNFVSMTYHDYYRYETQVRLINAKREIYSQLLRTPPADLTPNETKWMALSETDSDLQALYFEA